MKNIIRFATAFAIIAAFAIITVAPDASAGCAYCDSKFVAKAGQLYDDCVAEHCGSKVVAKTGAKSGAKAVVASVKPPVTTGMWCPSAQKQIAVGDTCATCESAGMILSEDGRSCIDKCSLVPPWTSCLTWCPSRNEGMGGFALAGEACLPCEKGTNGIACLKEAPASCADQLGLITVKLTTVQDTLDQMKATNSKPVWRESWFWILAALGLLNLVLGVLILRKLRR